VGRLGDLLSRVGAGLDEFLKFEHPDAHVNRENWRPVLDTPLPEKGIGIDAVTRELVEHVIPNGSSLARPGFTAYITTGATTASTLATASPPRNATCGPLSTLSRSCRSTGSRKCSGSAR
jgi:aromatic-L-amino-acid decarboxylase